MNVVQPWKELKVKGLFKRSLRAEYGVDGRRKNSVKAWSRSKTQRKPDLNKPQERVKWGST